MKKMTPLIVLGVTFYFNNRLKV